MKISNTKKCMKCLKEKSYKRFDICNKIKNSRRSICRLCWLENKKEYNASRIELDNKCKNTWAKNNPEKVKIARNKWKEKNIGKVKADRANAKERIAIATPKWLNKIHKKAIEAKYEMAELKTLAYGISYNVDHIIPLRGETVCGLHVPWNLEVITAKENAYKSNRIIPWRNEWGN